MPIKVLITDDHLLFRTGLRKCFEKLAEIEVIGEAEHGKDLLEQLEYLKPDIITLGISMPVMDGLQTLPIVKSRYPHIKVIMVTMHSDAFVIRRFIELGANAYLTKAAGCNEICEAVLACSHQWFYFSLDLLHALGVPEVDPDKVRNRFPDVYSTKEIQLIRGLKENKPDAELAVILDLSPRTIAAMIEKLHRKLGSSNNQELTEKAISKKIIE